MLAGEKWQGKIVNNPTRCKKHCLGKSSISSVSFCESIPLAPLVSWFDNFYKFCWVFTKLGKYNQIQVSSNLVSPQCSELSQQHCILQTQNRFLSILHICLCFRFSLRVLAVKCFGAFRDQNLQYFEKNSIV